MLPTERPPSVHDISAFLRSRLRDLLDADMDEMNRSVPLRQYGLDSLKSTVLAAELSEFLGHPVPVTLVWDHPTIDGLCRSLARDPRQADTDSAADVPPYPHAAHDPAEPIALVGIGCRLPGAADPASYWRLLMEGRDAVGTVSPARRELLERDGTTASFRWGGYIDAVDMFDPLFFGISPREAVSMDPQQRLVLETAWEALEDAGIPPDRLRGSRTGVFMGSSWSDYAALAHQNGGHGTIGPHTATGTLDSIIANRVSYVLGLNGPSMALDTACSSSLVAVHLACQSLRDGESELALAGGVNLNLLADHFLAMEQAGALSPEGRIKAFDARADGYVRAEGAAVAVLAPLRVALERELPVYCLIRGSAVNNDGLSNGLTAPSPRAQEALLRTAYWRAGVEPSLVDYVECHGTGTPLGDPIEVKALATVMGEGREDGDFLRIGSVKTNIGHLEPAAGIAGLIKVALALRNKVLPASLHYSRPNPQIPFGDMNLRVQDRTTVWPSRSDARRAGVSAFGIGGTNCHVVTEEFRQPECSLLVLGEDSERELADRVAEIRGALADTPGTDLQVLCRQAADAKPAGAFRLAAVARDRDELSTQLASFTAGLTAPGLATGTGGTGGTRQLRVAFLCSGTGSQWLGMCRELLAGMPAFRRFMVRADQRVRKSAGFSLIDELHAAPEHSRLNDMEVAQPLLFCIQAALADTWRSLGVEPHLVVGQSIGEFAAAHIAGALDFDDALLLATQHARLVQQLAVGRGDTMVVETDERTLTPRLSAFHGRLTVAGHNSPGSLLVSGETEALEALAEQLATDGITAHRVRMGYPAHSPSVDPVLAPLRAALEGLRPTGTRLPMISAVTGEITAGGDLGPDYWVRNVREPSDVAGALRTAEQQGVDVVVELSPHPVLLKPVRELFAGRPVICLPSLQRGTDDSWSLLSSLGELHAAGLPVAASSFVTGLRPRHVTPGGPGALAPARRTPEWQDGANLVPVTAHSREALVDTCRELSNHIERDAGLWVPDLAHTLANRRSHHQHRVVLLARDRQELLDNLARVTSREAHPGIFEGTVTGNREEMVAFVFNGSGTQWPGMGTDLLRWHAGFREQMELCDATVRDLAGWSVIEAMSAPADRSRLDDVDVMHPVLFSLQVSLARVWTDLGLRPTALVGHSVGEVAAACVGGALSLEDAARVAVIRSSLMQHEVGEGAVIAVEAPAEALAAHLARYDGQAFLAAVNSPTSVAVSGSKDALRALTEDLRRAGIVARPVRIKRAAHSPLLDAIAPKLRDALKGITPRPFEVPLHSTVADGLVDPVVDADYWARNLRDRVRFAPAVRALVQDDITTFVEIGPHSALRGAVEETALADGTRVHTVDTLRRDENDTRSLLGSVASLFTRDVPLTLRTLFPDNAQTIATPSVRWQKDRYWLTSTPRACVSATGEAPTSAAAVPPSVATAIATPDATGSQTPREVILREMAEIIAVPPERFAPTSRLKDFGLDSMLAIRLTNRLQSLFGHRVSPVEFLDDRTVPELLEALAGLVGHPGHADGKTAAGAPPRRQATRPEPASVVEDLTDEDAQDLLDELAARKLLDPPHDPPAPREALRISLEQATSFELAPAGHGQGSIWFMQQLSPEGVPYNLMLSAAIPTEVDSRALAQALRAVVERHPVLRTVFVEAGGRPYQVILTQPVHEFLTEDAAGLDDGDVHDLLVAHGHRPIDLDRGPILRAVLVTRGPRDNFLLLVMHHVAVDAASVDVVVRDLRGFYEQALQRDLVLQEPVAPYTDFVSWEQAWLNGPDAARALSWWAEHLAEPPPNLDLPRADGEGTPAGERSALVTYQGADLTFRWSADEARRLAAFAVDEGVSMSTLVLSGFFATLNRVTGTEDAIVATAVAQRGEPGRESAVGCYVNTVPVRARPSGKNSFRDLLHGVHQVSLGLLEHMNYPLDRLVAELNPSRAVGRSPWSDMAVNWLSGSAFPYVTTLFHGVGEAEEPSGALPLVPLPMRRDIAKFDLEITMADVAGGVVGQVQYKPSSVQRETVTMLLKEFRSVLFRAVEQPDLPLDQLPQECGEEETQ
ncbi:acyltransferase domain-containing protein [Streptomyces sp. NPDC054841]